MNDRRNMLNVSCSDRRLGVRLTCYSTPDVRCLLLKATHFVQMCIGRCRNKALSFSLFYALSYSLFA